MTFETKFALGDEVWMMKDNKPVQLLIESISAQIYSDVSVHICYKLNKVDNQIHESFLFATKAELLASL